MLPLWQYLWPPGKTRRAIRIASPKMKLPATSVAPLISNEMPRTKSQYCGHGRSLDGGPDAHAKLRHGSALSSNSMATPRPLPIMPMWLILPGFRTQAPAVVQQAVELAAERAGEPSLRIEASAPDPVEAFAARWRDLPPAQRRRVAVALAALALELLRGADFLLKSRGAAGAMALVALALAVFTLLATLKE
jgi:hypothetical protein